MQFHPHPAAFQVPVVLKWLVGRPAAHAWILVLLGVDLAALGDVITGPLVWFGPVYLLVISLAAWCRGWRAGVVTGIACMAMTMAINGVNLYPYGRSDWLMNFVTRVAALLIVVTTVAGSRSVYIREWWLARTDPLTGAFNRQAFFELGDELAADASWRLLIYADLDGLKAINDLHGHAAGDAAISGFATLVRRSIRRTDLFARVGGDEFLIFMQVRDCAAAEGVARRLHAVMNSLPLEFGRDLRCSVGAAIAPPGEMKIDALVRAADALMYAAKQRGACLQVDLLPAAIGTVRWRRARAANKVSALGSQLVRAQAFDRRGLVAGHRGAPSLAQTSRVA